MNIFYLGPTKTFSEKAAITLVNDLNLQGKVAPMPNFEIVAKSVADSPASVGVLPYYNFLEGLVQETLDLIYENSLRIEYGVRLPIELSIGGVSRELKANVVYSHPKALAQCSDYIQKNLVGVEISPVSSTAEAARLVGDKRQELAIASRVALEDNNLIIIDEDIGNRRHGRSNFTDFLLISSKQLMNIPKSNDWRTMVAITPHMDKIGLLADILGLIGFYGLNLAKIHSRPAIDTISVDIEPQMFYLELMCNPDSEDLKRCMDALDYRFDIDSNHGHVVRLLGSFPALN